MKKILLTFWCLLSSVLLMAQSTHEKKLLENISVLNSTKSPSKMEELAYNFEKLINQKENSWYPNYYAALSLFKSETALMNQGNTQGSYRVAAIMEKFIAPVMEKESSNPEVLTILAGVHIMRMVSSPQENYASEVKLAKEILFKAEKIEPKNPRVALFKGLLEYYSLKNTGGNKELAKNYFTDAITNFKTNQKKGKLDPTWGEGDAQNYLSLLK